MLGLVLTGLWLAGCRAPSSQFGDAPGSPSAGASTTTNSPSGVKSGPIGPEIIKVGDSLTVVFSDFRPEPQSIIDTVKGDGTITLLLDQQFHADGKTRGELEREIRANYVPKFFKYLTVTIVPKVQFYFVGGEVRSPNRYQYLGTTSVTRAIQSAGDFTDFARRRTVKLYRVDGRIETVDCLQALKNPNLDLQVFPGDTIKVPRRHWPWQ
jgi:polysaccharide export outer membrane protein